MPELTFVFGPNNTFFFDCPKSWKFHNIPPTLRQLFNSSMSPAWRIAQPYCLALGPQNNSPEPIWYIGCKVLDGTDKIFYSQNTFDLNYPDLSRWSKTIPNGPRACHVVFGPGLSYFACAQGYGSIWAGVPGEMTDKVQKAYETPSQVALGLNNAWFVMWPDGYYSWKFYGSYSGLDQILKHAEPRTVSYLAISPYNKEHYFVAFKDRTVKYNFVGAPEWMPQMQQVFSEWQAEIMARQAALQQPQYAMAPPHYRPQSFSSAPPTPRTPSSGLLSPTMTPQTPLPPYATPITPPFSPYSPYGPPPGQPGYIAPPSPNMQRSSSTEKRKSFFHRDSTSRESSRNSSVVAAGGAAMKVGSVIAQEGGQTCNVM